MTQQAMELVSSNINGNCCFIAVKTPGVPEGTILLETLHLIECLAPASLGAAQYLPPNVVRSLVSVDSADLAERVPFQKWENTLDIDHETTKKILTQQELKIRQLVHHAEDVAREKFVPIRQQALADMSSQLDEEIRRLQALAQVNPNVRPEEIDFMVDRKNQLSAVIAKSQIRLDAVRLILVA